MEKCPYCHRTFADQNGVWMHAKAKHPTQKTAYLRPVQEDLSMKPYFQAMNERKKERKAERLDKLEETLAGFRAAGATVELVQAESHHYRITDAQGVEYDYWASTSAWMKKGARNSSGGLHRLMSRLAGAAASAAHNARATA